VAAADLIEEYLSKLGGDSRRLAHTEWGLTVPAEAAGGWELHVGLRIADGLLTAKAPVLDAGAGVDPWMLLWWNRQTRMVRFACNQAGEIWVHADLPAAGLDERGLDRLLGLVCEGAVAGRGYARSEPSTGPSMRTWLGDIPKPR